VITVGGQQLPWSEGMTIADILADLDDGNQYAVVRVNDQYVSRPNFGKTRVPDGAQVFLIPMIAGG
jgi:thiamine biosynthesis protein ThiS